MKVSAAAAAVLIALVASVQSSDPCNTTTCYKSGTTKTPPTTATTPTRLPVKTSTPAAAKTTYAKDHAHTTVRSGPTATATAASTTASTGASKAHGGNVTATTAAGNVTHAAAVNATTSKPATLTEGHLALKQKLNTIAVRCKDELHAPQEIMALVSNTVVPQNEQQRCYLECVYKALNLVKNSKFSVADGKKLAQIRFAAQPEEHKKAVTIIETCEKEVIVDPKSTEKCATGRVIRNCFVKNGEKINFFPKA